MDTLQHFQQLKNQLIEAYKWIEEIYVDCHDPRELANYTEEIVIPYLEDRDESHFTIKEKK